MTDRPTLRLTPAPWCSCGEPRPLAVCCSSAGPYSRRCCCFGGERDRGRLQRLAHPRRRAAGRCDVGGKVFMIRSSPSTTACSSPSTGSSCCRCSGAALLERIPDADDLLASRSGGRDSPRSLGVALSHAVSSRSTISRRAIQDGAPAGADVPSLRPGDGATRRDPGRWLPRRQARLTAHPLALLVVLKTGWTCPGICGSTRPDRSTPSRPISSA